jgi:hypothetical protein
MYWNIFRTRRKAHSQNAIRPTPTKYMIERMRTLLFFQPRAISLNINGEGIIAATPTAKTKALAEGSSKDEQRGNSNAQIPGTGHIARSLGSP